jgi:4'-phosphopantetheinyl transferase
VASVYVWWARRQDSSPRLEALFGEVERGRWATYRRAEDRDRFMVGNALAKTAVAQLTGQDPEDVAFDRSCAQCGKPHGKPRVVGGGPELSVSHSGDLIAVAVHRVYPVGVDVEQIRDTRDREALERFVMSDAEAGDLFAVWTRKEAVTKATGDGLRVSFKEVVLAEEPLRVVAWPYQMPPSDIRLSDLDTEPGYAAALAVIGDVDDVLVRDGTALLAEKIRRL